jgi:ABC-type molybdate transport system ATPase subunit
VFCFHVLYRYRKAPIIILDEPDGSLDQRNVMRLAKFLKQNSHLQIIIITHRHQSAYAVVADDVIGVVKQVRLNGDGRSLNYASFLFSRVNSTSLTDVYVSVLFCKSVSYNSKSNIMLLKLTLLIQCVESVTDRLSPGISLINEAVFINCSGIAMMLLPKYALVKSPFSITSL